VTTAREELEAADERLRRAMQAKGSPALAIACVREAIWELIRDLRKESKDATG
jgi:hypothetical protein